MASSHPIDAFETTIDQKIEVHRKIDALQRNSFEDNGFPESCFGCSFFENKMGFDRTKVHGPKGINERVILKVERHCNRGGCDKARKQFVENIGRLKTLGKARIDLEVKITRQHIPISNFGAGPAAMMHSSFPSDEYEVRAIPLKPSGIGTTGKPFDSEGIPDQHLANFLAQEAMARVTYSENIPDSIRLQHELDEFIESETQMSAYGESAWA